VGGVLSSRKRKTSVSDGGCLTVVVRSLYAAMDKSVTHSKALRGGPRPAAAGLRAVLPCTAALAQVLRSRPVVIANSNRRLRHAQKRFM
jgi:hypothetical protein